MSHFPLDKSVVYLFPFLVSITTTLGVPHSPLFRVLFFFISSSLVGASCCSLFILLPGFPNHLPFHVLFARVSTSSPAELFAELRTSKPRWFPIASFEFGVVPQLDGHSFPRLILHFSIPAFSPKDRAYLRDGLFYVHRCGFSVTNLFPPLFCLLVLRDRARFVPIGLSMGALSPIL